MIKVKSYIRWGMSTLLLLAVMTAMSSISVFAWSAETKTTNVVTMSSLHAEIVEEYKRPPFVMPGERTDKKVNIRNTGSADALVRVKLDYDSSILIPELNTGLWELHDDGYFYYKEILKSGEITKEPLLNSVTLSEKAGESYQGKELQLLVSAETVQAEGDGPALWKTTYKELQITQPEQQKAEPVKVVFEGKDKGFRSDTKGMDLFSGFKNLQPGTERTQIIQLENTSGDKADFTLRAEAAEQEKMTEDQKKLVEKLLESYAVITVTSGGKVIYEGSASGNLTGSDSEKTMKQNISLGTIAPGKTQEIRVDLKLSEEMDNEYQQLIGKVHWILQAKESEPDPTPISEKESETEPTSIREKESETEPTSVREKESEPEPTSIHEKESETESESVRETESEKESETQTTEAETEKPGGRKNKKSNSSSGSSQGRSGNTGSPKTGDETPRDAWMLAFCMGLAVAVSGLVYRRRNSRS